MGKIIIDGVEYNFGGSSASAGDNIEVLTREEYNALEASGQVDPNAYYFITGEGGSGSSGSVGSASELVYDNSTSGLEATSVQEAVDEVVSKMSVVTTPTLLKTVTSFKDSFTNTGVNWTQYKKITTIVKFDYNNGNAASQVSQITTVPTAVISTNDIIQILPYQNENVSNTVEVDAKFTSNNIQLIAFVNGDWSIVSCKIYGE